MEKFLEELKRRNVFRVAVAYLVAAWLVLQVAQLLLEAVEAPAWVIQVFLIAFALGFPIVLTFSWVYELTPEGIKKETDVDRTTSITSDTGRKLDMATIGMLIAVLSFVVIERTLLDDPAPVEQETAAAAASDVLENSIAVLAFEDLSPGGDHEYFADGLSEEILNVLAKIDALQVAGRTSSFAFKGQNTDLREIGDVLNVAHILEGSVRKSGDQIRVTAQLIKASNGFHLFSETYDRKLEDVFKVQDEIARMISDALLAEIVGSDQPDAATPTDPEAYDLFLAARQRIHTRDIAALREAYAMLERAVDIDPNYAPAMSQKALAYFLMSDSMGAYGDIPSAEAMPAAFELVDRALELDPELADAYAVRGLLLDQSLRYHEAVDSLERAVELNPNHGNAINWLSTAYNNTNRHKDSTALLEEAVRRDPLYPPAFNNLSIDYARTGRADEAIELIDRVSRIVGENINVHFSRGVTYLMQGASAESAKNFKVIYDSNPTAEIYKLWYGFALLQMADYERLLAVGVDEHRMLALEATGSGADALELVGIIDAENSDPSRVTSDIGLVMLLQGRSQEFLDYLQTQADSYDELLERYAYTSDWGAAFLPEIAYACRDVGDEPCFDRFMTLIEEQIDRLEARGDNNWVLWGTKMQYSALRGDAESAAESFEYGITAGLRGESALRSPVFDAVRDDPAFAAQMQRHNELVDKERAAWGLPPYRPVTPTDASSFVN